MDDPFATALEAGRRRYNTQFALARMGQPRLQPEAFLAHLGTTVRPIIEAVHRHDPARVEAVLDVLYEVSLDLVGRGWMGPESHFPFLDDGWKRLFVECASLLAEAPKRVVTALTNALYNLSQEPSARPEAWIDGMIAVGSRAADLEEWLEAGKVLAWRSGLAHYRDGALDACARLSPAVAAVAMGLEAELSETALAALLDDLKKDRWASPADVLAQASERKRVCLVGVCGGFQGTGGPFLTPPRVAVQDGGFVAWDQEFLWALHADVFGTVFRRLGKAPESLESSSASSLQIDADGTVRSEDNGEVFPGLASWSSAAAAGDTLAVTLPDAHFVYLVGLTV